MITFSIMVLIGVIGLVVAGSILMAALSIPFALLFAVLPWLLRIVGVVLLLKALFDKPVKWENFMPAIIAFVLSALIRWIF